MRATTTAGLPSSKVAECRGRAPVLEYYRRVYGTPPDILSNIVAAA